MPVAAAKNAIKSAGAPALLHCDAVQAFGKMEIDVSKLGVDMLTFSGHKIHGPKGVGFLYINEKVKIHPIAFGGGQQKGIRSGTENVPGIAGLSKAVEMVYQNLEEDVTKMYALKEYFMQGIEKIDYVILNGPKCHEGAPHIISVSFGGIRSEVVLHALEDKGIYVSAGSACASNKQAFSATLQAINVDKRMLDSTIRFSMSVFTTKEEIDYTLQCLYDIIPMLRKYTRH
jgi:cysteine desulfurase